ncbi:MAG: hypothetical protein HY329_06920 [Chloroflexi bacterium]|nr:hypothetical protein [Chloroflexota bacterium]
MALKLTDITVQCATCATSFPFDYLRSMDLFDGIERKPDDEYWPALPEGITPDALHRFCPECDELPTRAQVREIAMHVLPYDEFYPFLGPEAEEFDFVSARH